jgi:hypothetical protein
MVRLRVGNRFRFTPCSLFLLVCSSALIPASGEELSLESSIGGSSYFFGVYPDELVAYGEGTRLVLADIDDLSTPIGTLELGGRLHHANFEAGQNRLYVSAGRAGLSVIDVSVPSDPKFLHTIIVDGEVTGSDYLLLGEQVVVLFSATKYPDNFVELPTTTLYDYEITDVQVPVARGTYEVAGEARFVVDEGTLYVTDRNSGVRVVNFSDPANPSLIGTIPTWQGDTATSVAITDNHVLVGDENGMTVAGAQNRQLLGYLDLGFEVRGIGPTEDGQGAFLTGSGASVVAVNLSDPTAPFTLGGAGSQGYFLNVVGGLAAVAQGEQGIALYNIGFLPSPDSQRFQPNDPVTHFVAHQDHYYAVTSPVPEVLRRDDLDLVRVGSAGFYGANTILDMVSNGGLIYMITNFDGSLHIFDLSDPEHPSEVGAVEVGQMTSLDANAGIVCAVGTVNGIPTLQVVNATTPTAPGTPTGLELSGAATGVAFDPGNPQRCYIFSSGVLQSVDVSDPDNPQVLGSVKLEGVSGRGMTVSGNYVYASTSFQGTHVESYRLEVVDVSDPTRPTIVGKRSLLSPMTNLQVVGNFLYGIEGHHVLRYNLTNPEQPQFIDAYYAPNQPNQFNVEGDTVYTAGGKGYFAFNLNSYTSIPEEQGHTSNLPVANAPVTWVDDAVVCGPGVNEWREDLGVRGSGLLPGVDYAVFVNADLSRFWAGGPAGLDEYQLSSINPPELLRTAYSGNLSSLDVEGEFAYVAGPDGLLRLDLTTQPATELGGHPDPIHFVTVSGNYAYTLGRDFTSGLRGVFQPMIVLPEPVTPRGWYRTPQRYDFTSGIADQLDFKRGGKELRTVVYCGYFRQPFPGDPDPVWGHAGMVAIDATDPDSPVALDVLPAGKENFGLAIDGDRAYLAAGADGIINVDISDPTDLKIVETYPTGWPATGVAAEDGRIAATLGPGGLLVLQGLEPAPSGPDIDGSGVVNAVDVQLVVNAVLGISIDPFSGDVNDDGALNAIDVQLVVNAVLGIL